MSITKRKYGELEGQEVFAYTLDNQKGLSAEILNYGGIITRLVFNGIDVALGWDNFDEYRNNGSCYGAMIGRNSNRIEKAQFELNGKKYTLVANDKEKSNLHGGPNGFDKKIWRAEEKEDGLHLFYTSPDGEENYPGTLEVEVCYYLDEDDGLQIRYKAKTDQDTVVNLTNHAYFNLNGHQNGSLENHNVRIFADYFTENDENCLPTGEILPVAGTPMDFREMQAITARIAQDNVQLKRGNGYDHNWIIKGEGFRQCAEAVGEITKIKMETLTDQPGMQFYTANYLAPDKKGKDDAGYCPRSAFCFETQGFPNATAFTHFPSPVLRADEVYNRKTIYRLSRVK